MDIGPVGISTYGMWQDADDAAEAVVELDDLGYGALWLGSSDGGLELHEALLAASRRIVVSTAIINIWMNPPATVAASYQRVERSHPGRMLIGLGSSHCWPDPGQGIPPLPEDGQLPRRTRRPYPDGAHGSAGNRACARPQQNNVFGWPPSAAPGATQTR